MAISILEDDTVLDWVYSCDPEFKIKYRAPTQADYESMMKLGTEPDALLDVLDRMVVSWEGVNNAATGKPVVWSRAAAKFAKPYLLNFVLDVGNVERERFRAANARLEVEVKNSSAASATTSSPIGTTSGSAGGA